MTSPAICAAPDRHPRKPRHAIPLGTTDCHCHVFEDPQKYPLSLGRSYTPPLFTADDYLAMCKVLGIERTVQVNASVYGYDNSVKISSWYRRSDAPPSFADMKALAQALIAVRPDRCVWGTNWPHPKCDVPMPNDGDLIDQFCDWVPDETMRRKVLVENPARLYGFN